MAEKGLMERVLRVRVEAQEAKEKEQRAAGALAEIDVTLKKTYKIDPDALDATIVTLQQRARAAEGKLGKILDHVEAKIKENEKN